MRMRYIPSYTMMRRKIRRMARIRPGWIGVEYARTVWTHSLTMAEDVLDDYFILYGTTEGAQRMEADMLTFFRAAIADPDTPLPSADDLYLAMKGME